MKKILQKIRLFLGKLCLDHANEQSFQATDAPKIIVLQQDGKIGDYIVSSFIFRELRKQYPKARLDVVCSYGNLQLFQDNEFIDNFYTLNRRKVCSYVKIGRQLSHQHYDYLINLPVLLRNRDLLLTRLIHAKVNIGYQKSRYKIFNLNVVEDNLHFSEIYRKAIELCGVESVNPDYLVPLNDFSEQNVSGFIAEHHLQHAIAINFFGAANSRKFSEDNIAKFLSVMTQKFPQKKFILLSFPAVSKSLQSIAECFPQVFVYSSSKTIFDSIALIKYCDTVISPDTSIIHIAAGLGKNIVAFYQENNPQNLQQWHPNTARSHILYFKQSVNEISAHDIQPEWLEVSDRA